MHLPAPGQGLHFDLLDRTPGSTARASAVGQARTWFPTSDIRGIYKVRLRIFEPGSGQHYTFDVCL